MQEDGTVLQLEMNNGYVTIPALAKGTLIIPYVGSKEATTAVGGSTSYALGYPVKHVFRLLFNAFDNEGEAAYLLGKVAIVNGDGTYDEIKISEQGISTLASQCQDGEYKKERANIAYSGALKNIEIAYEPHDSVTIEVNAQSVRYGAEVVYTVSNLAAGDSIIAATVNGVDVLDKLVLVGGVYTYTTIAKENIVFSIVLDSDPKDCVVTVNYGENATASVKSVIIKENEQLRVTILANSYYQLSSIKVNGEEMISTMVEGVLSITVTEDTQIDVLCTPIDYTITYVLNGGVNNSENITTFNIESEAFVLLPATYLGNVFEGWYIDEEKVEIVSDELLGNITLEAKWSKETYTIGYSINTNEGTISPAKMNAEYGEEIAYTVVANSGYEIKEIKVNNETIEHNNGQFNVTISSNTVISVVFELKDVDQTSSNSGEKDSSNQGASGSGCFSTIGAGTGIIVASAFVAMAIVLKKKRED